MQRGYIYEDTERKNDMGLNGVSEVRDRVSERQTDGFYGAGFVVWSLARIGVKDRPRIEVSSEKKLTEFGGW